ncbi:MAG: hypothetical protein M3132_05325 [Actinomycetia bacterium]|nr:hypothetical protein [Actinomycetes bacterium]
MNHDVELEYDHPCDDDLDHVAALHGLDQAITRCLQISLGATRDYVPEVRHFIDYLKRQEEQWKESRNLTFTAYRIQQTRLAREARRP